MNDAPKHVESVTIDWLPKPYLSPHPVRGTVVLVSDHAADFARGSPKAFHIRVRQMEVAGL